MTGKDFNDIFKVHVFNDSEPDFEAVWNIIMTSDEEAVNISKENNEPFME